MTSVKAIFGGDARGFEAATEKMARVSKANAAKIAANYQSELAKVESALTRVTEGSTAATALNTQRQFLKTKLETAARNEARMGASGFTHGGIAGMAGGGRRASFGAASSMFVSAARDSAASLASGAPITQVIAQQAPQVLQALAMMKAGTLAIGVAAAGVAAYGLFKMVSAFKDSYLLTDRIREGLDRIAIMTNDLKNKSDLKLIQQEQELENELKAIERKKEQAKFDEDAATAAAEMEKALITKHHLEQNSVRTAKSELELKEKLLEVELKLALLKATTKPPEDRPKELVDAEKELAAARREQEMYNPEELRQQMYARHAQERPTFGIASNELLKKHHLESANLENEIAVKSGEIFDRVSNARKNLSAVKDRLSGQKTPEQQAADLAVLKIQNEIKELGIKDRRSTSSGGSISAKTGAMIALSEWERAGGRMAGPNIPQDVQKLQLGELKGIGRTLTEIKTRLRGGASF